MSENYTIQDLGGKELARHYPDKGLLPDSNWYNSIVRTEPEVKGILSWLGSFKHVNQFWAVLSANAEGLRVLISSDEFAIFIPWKEATLHAERSSPATLVTLKTIAVPSLTLLIHLDDDAADDLFKTRIPPLPRRDPPRQLVWWRDRPWLGLLVLLAGVCGALLTWYVLHRR